MTKVFIDDWYIVKDDNQYTIVMKSSDEKKAAEIQITSLDSKKLELAKEISMTEDFKQSIFYLKTEEEEDEPVFCLIYIEDDEIFGKLYFTDEEERKDYPIKTNPVSAICEATNFGCHIEISQDDFEKLSEGKVSAPHNEVSLIHRDYYEGYTEPMLNELLNDAVKCEDFEKAAKIRDLIFKKFPNSKT